MYDSIDLNTDSPTFKKLVTPKWHKKICQIMKTLRFPVIGFNEFGYKAMKGSFYHRLIEKLPPDFAGRENLKEKMSKIKLSSVCTIKVEECLDVIGSL